MRIIAELTELEDIHMDMVIAIYNTKGHLVARVTDETTLQRTIARLRRKHSGSYRFVEERVTHEARWGDAPYPPPLRISAASR